MREYSMCTRVCSRVHVYIRARVCVWRGLVAARLPASALGCAARQDVEPSATQPGDHPRVQPALSPFSSSSPTTQATSRYSSSSSSSSSTFATVSSRKDARARIHLYTFSLSLCLSSSLRRVGRYLFLFSSPLLPRYFEEREGGRAAPPAPPREHSPGAVVPTCTGISSPPTAPSHAR